MIGETIDIYKSQNNDEKTSGNVQESAGEKNADVPSNSVKMNATWAQKRQNMRSSSEKH